MAEIQSLDMHVVYAPNEFNLQLMQTLCINIRREREEYNTAEYQ